MEIRFAKEKDCKKIYSLLKEIATLHYELRPDLFKNSPKYTLSEIKALIGENNNIILVAADYNDMPLGYCLSFKTEKNGCKILYIDDLYVDKAYRRQGIAKRLIFETKKTAAGSNIKTIELHAFCNNDGAVKFYENIGMKKRYIVMEYNEK